jgi:hypothetical protein
MRGRNDEKESTNCGNMISIHRSIRGSFLRSGNETSGSYVYREHIVKYVCRLDCLIYSGAVHNLLTVGVDCKLAIYKMLALVGQPTEFQV